jgi:hypothetical protein
MANMIFNSSKSWLACAALIGLAAAGCEMFESARQGTQSTYKKELKQIAEDVNREELARAPRSEGLDAKSRQEEPGQARTDDIAQANHWRSPALAGSVKLQPPIAGD